MSLIKRILGALQSKENLEDEGGRRPEVYARTRPLIGQIQRLARREGVSADVMTVEILRAGIADRQAFHDSVRRWRSLTPKEKEVAAYICWGLSNGEIGERLFIAKGTVRTHVRHILQKFGVENRQQVQEMLRWWDYGAWVE